MNRIIRRFGAKIQTSAHSTHLDRTVKIFLFYTSFYTFLFSFWLFMLLVFLETVDNDRPNWANQDSLLKMNPGLSFRPRIPYDKADSSIIIFNLNNSKTWKNWVDDLDQYLNPYLGKKVMKENCLNQPLRTANCPFVPDFQQRENPCNLPDFGYGLGEPCFLIKLNRIFYWEPSPYRSVTELPKGLRSISGLEDGKGLILIECKGETQFDNDSINKTVYWPFQGFPAEMYPYVNQKDYLSPFVMVRLMGVRRNVPISIECRAYDKRIRINKSEKIGFLQFELMVLDEPPLT